MNWDGNPSIVLDIKTYLGVALPVQVTWFFSLIFIYNHVSFSLGFRVSYSCVTGNVNVLLFHHFLCLIFHQFFW